MRTYNRKRLAWMLIFVIAMGCFANGGAVRAEEENFPFLYLLDEDPTVSLETVEGEEGQLKGTLAVSGSAVTQLSSGGSFYVTTGSALHVVESKKGDYIKPANITAVKETIVKDSEGKALYGVEVEVVDNKTSLEVWVSKADYDAADVKKKSGLYMWYQPNGDEGIYCLGEFKTESETSPILPSPTPTPTGTSTPGPTPTEEPTPTPTGTSTPSPTPTEEPTPTPTGTSTPSPTPTGTLTPSPTPTEEPAIMYKIVYKLDGGTISSNYPERYESGKGLSEAEMPVPSKEGYLFGGWYSGNTRYAGIAATVSGDLQLTAKWYAITLTCETGNGYVAVGEALSLNADIDGGIKNDCQFVWKHAGEERRGAKVSFDISGTGEQVYYCTVSYGIYSQSVKITVTGYNAKIKITLNKTKSTKDIFGKEVSLDAISLAKSKDKKYVTLNKKKGTIKIKKYVKSTKVYVTVNGQKLTVTVSVQLPVPKVKAKKGKVTSYVVGKYRRFKLVYSNITGADKIVSYYSKKKNKGYKKGGKSQNKKKGASVSIPKGSKYYFKVVAYYGKAKSPQSKVVLLKG